MDTTVIIIIAAVLAVVVVGIVSFLGGKSITQKSNQEIEKKAEEEVKKKLADAKIAADKLIADAQRNAENTKKDKMLEAKENFIQLKAKHESEVAERNKKAIEKEIDEKEDEFKNLSNNEFSSKGGYPSIRNSKK